MQFGPVLKRNPDSNGVKIFILSLPSPKMFSAYKIYI